jgi:hypothetical protein
VDWIQLAQDGVQWWNSCVYGNEHFGSIKDGKYLDLLCDYQRLRKDLVWPIRYFYFVYYKRGTRKFITVFTKAHYWALS